MTLVAAVERRKEGIGEPESIFTKTKKIEQKIHVKGGEIYVTNYTKKSRRITLPSLSGNQHNSSGNIALPSLSLGRPLSLKPVDQPLSLSTSFTTSTT